jgi:hypothetical protein
MSKRKKVLTTMFSMKRAKARRHTGPARPVLYVKRAAGFAKRNRKNRAAFGPPGRKRPGAAHGPKMICKQPGNEQKKSGE